MNSHKKSGCVGCFKYLFYAICFVAFLFAITDGKNLLKDVSKGGGIVEPIKQDVSQFYYEQLNATEKNIYDTMLQSVQDGKLKHTFSNVNGNEYSQGVKRAMSALTYDHPEYFWLREGYSASWKSDSIDVEALCFGYWSYTMSPQKYVNELKQAVDNVVEKAKKYNNVYEQAQFVHDYLVQNAEYDHDALAEAQKTMHDVTAEYIWSAYGCLVNGKTVCAGYAKAFQLIMCNLGVECIYVVGSAGEAHAWNLIMLEDDGYFIDVTWDDHDLKDDKGTFKYVNDSEYNYFCITDKSLAYTHQLDESQFNIPDCTATKYNYYEYYDYKVATYNLEKVKSIFDKQSGKKIISIQFGNLDELNKAVGDLFSAGRWKEIISSQEITYRQDEYRNILTIYL